MCNILAITPTPSLLRQARDFREGSCSLSKSLTNSGKRLDAVTHNGPACLKAAFNLTVPCGASMHRSVMGINKNLQHHLYKSGKSCLGDPAANSSKHPRGDLTVWLRFPNTTLDVYEWFGPAPLKMSSERCLHHKLRKMEV